jgi:hypothetical protein
MKFIRDSAAKRIPRLEAKVYLNNDSCSIFEDETTVLRRSFT